MKTILRPTLVVLLCAAASVCMAADEQVPLRLAKIVPLSKIRSETVLSDLTERRDKLEIWRSEIKQKVQKFNALGPVKPGSQAEAQRRRDLEELSTAAKSCTEAVNQFNSEVEEEVICGEAAQTEQELFATNPGAWSQAMKLDLINISEPRARAVSEEMLEAMKQSGGKTPLSKLPKTPADLAPGDILLMTPDATSPVSRAIPSMDQHYRRIGAYFSNNSPPQQTERHDIAHTVLYLRSVNGRRLYLDHQVREGSRVLDEREFQAKYAERLSYVAIPQADVDGEKLWAAAREAALYSGSEDYGVRGNAKVCSEKDVAVLVRATDMKLNSIYEMVGGLGRAVEITPSNFFNEKLKRGYFTVTPLKAR